MTTPIEARASLVLYAKDVQRVADFYAAVLGLSRSTTQDGYVALNGPTYSMLVVRIRPHLADKIEIQSPPQRRENVALKMVMPVESISRARAAAPAYGGAVDPAEREWTFDGLLRCDCVDCEGNIIQLAEPALVVAA